jgi:hypothetical protein
MERSTPIVEELHSFPEKRSLLFPFCIVLSFFAVSCGNGQRGEGLHADPHVGGGNGVSVAIEPAEVTLRPQEMHLFTAAVSGSPDTGVIWQVEEGEAGGTIAPDGTYTASSNPGIYHIVAISLVDPGQRRSATVVVEPPSAPPDEGDLPIAPPKEDPEIPPDPPPSPPPLFIYVASSDSSDVTM